MIKRFLLGLATVVATIIVGILTMELFVAIFGFGGADMVYILASIGVLAWGFGEIFFGDLK